MVVFDLKPELRFILREFLLRVGYAFNVNSDLTGSSTSWKPHFPMIIPQSINDSIS